MWDLLRFIIGILCVAGLVYGPWIAGQNGTLRGWLILIAFEMACFLPTVAYDKMITLPAWFRVGYHVTLVGLLVALWFMSEDWRYSLRFWWEDSLLRMLMIAWWERVRPKD